MRVLYYTYSLCVGGAETVVTENLLNLKARGVEVCLVEDFHTDSFLSRRLEAGGIPIFTLWKGSASSNLGMQRKRLARKLGLYRKFNGVIQAFQPDVIHFHGMPDHPERLAFPQNRMLYSFHSEIRRNLTHLGPENTACLKRMTQRGMLLCGLTQTGVAELKTHFETDRVLCTPNGLDFGQIRAQRYTRAQLWELLGIPETGLLLGTVGRLHPVKNHERMLSIFREVKKSCPDARLVLVGGDSDGRMELLKAQAAAYGIGADVFFAGMRQDADAIVAAMDCFLLTSFSECFPLVVMEAQAQGVRCVCSQAVPQECLCRQDAVGLSLEDADAVWAETILKGNRVNPTPKDPDQYDIHHVMDNLVDTYQRLANA